MQFRKRLFLKLLCSFIATSINGVNAKELDITPNILLKSTYISNENQSPTPVSADIITEVSPGISMKANSMRAKGSLDYSLRKQVSYTRDINNLNHKLDGEGNFALVKNYVNLFATGNYGQRTNRIGRNILFDNSLQLENISNFGAVSAGIDLTNGIKRYFDSKLRYTYNTRKSSSTTYADTSSNNLVASLDNGASFRRLIWGGNANYRELNYDNRQPRKIAEVTGKLGYRINQQTGFRISAGYESNPQYLRVRPNSPSKGYIATVTAFWRSPKNLGLEVMAGKRAFGKSYQISTSWLSSTANLSASYGRTVLGDRLTISALQRVRQAVFRLQYNETLSDYNYVSFTLVPAQITAPDENQLNPPLLLLPAVQTGTYVIRRASSGMTLTGIKTRVDLGADYSTRKYTNSGISSRTYKANAELKVKLNTLANTTLTIEAVDANDRTIGAKGLYTSIKLSYEHKIKKIFLASLSGQRWERKPGDNQNITVNLINVSVKVSY